MASRNPASLESLAKEERAAGRSVLVDDVDIGSGSSLHGLRDRVLDQHSRLDGIVFNTVIRPMASMDDDLARWRESMEVNATGFFATVRVFGDAMALHGSGNMVNIASQMGIIGVNPWLYEGHFHDCGALLLLSQRGQINLTRYLARAAGLVAAGNARVGSANAGSPGASAATGRRAFGGDAKSWAQPSRFGEEMLDLVRCTVPRHGKSEHSRQALLEIKREMPALPADPLFNGILEHRRRGRVEVHSPMNRTAFRDVVAKPHGTASHRRADPLLSKYGPKVTPDKNDATVRRLILREQIGSLA